MLARAGTPVADSVASPVNTIDDEVVELVAVAAPGTDVVVCCVVEVPVGWTLVEVVLVVELVVT